MIPPHVLFELEPAVPGFPVPVRAGLNRDDSPEHVRTPETRARLPLCLYQYTLSGRGFFEYDGRDHELRSGSAFLCRLDGDNIRFGFPPDGNEPWVSVFLVFLNMSGVVDGLVQRFGPVVRSVERPGIVSCLRERVSEGRFPVVVGPEDALGLVTGALGAFAAAATHPEAASTASLLVRRALAAVRRRVGERLEVRDLAAMVEVTPEHLCRVFRSELGITPGQYIARAKVHRACDLLLSTDLSIKEIHLELGYDRASNFARAFRRVTGMTPGQFRSHPFTAGLPPLWG